MKRDPATLSKSEYDVLIIGGGIHGATIAWDAALRGLSVALIDKGDFVSGNSSNSLKTVHGGLRYLQQADFRRMRASIRERGLLMRLAPHLVYPLPFLLPTSGKLMKSKWLMHIGMAVNDIVGFNRNKLHKDPSKFIPKCRVISRKECLELAPGLDKSGVTGAAVWYDGQMHNSERLALEFILSAAKQGAEAANYIQANGFMLENGKVIGAKAKDLLTGDEFEIRSRLVINATGPRIDNTLGLIENRQAARSIQLSTAMNLIINREIVSKYAVGVRSRYQNSDPGGKVYRGSRVLFLAPWRGATIVGTQHRPFEGEPEGFSVTEEMITEFIDEINVAYPGAQIRRDEVAFVHQGLIPMDGTYPKLGEVKLTAHHKIHDHEHEEGLAGLISVLGVKYTTARDVAERTVNLAFKKLGKKVVKCRTDEEILVGGRIEQMEDFLNDAIREKPHGLDEKIIRHLVHTYGSEYKTIINYVDDDPDLGSAVPGSSEVTKAEVVHAVREEMACKLSDVLLRRTDLGAAGHPGEECIDACAQMMAEESGWDIEKTQEEIKQVTRIYPTVTG